MGFAWELVGRDGTRLPPSLGPNGPASRILGYPPLKLEPRFGVEPNYLVYKTGASPSMLTRQILELHCGLEPHFPDYETGMSPSTSVKHGGQKAGLEPATSRGDRSL